MPTYPYRCPTCGDDYSVTTTIKEYAELRTPVCGGSHPPVDMHRVYQPPSFTVQGLAGDRFKYRDKIAANRQAVIDKGMPDDLG